MEAHRQKAPGVGETLPPECNPLLRSLRLWEAFQRSAPIESPGIVSRWGHPAPTEQDFLSNPHGTGWHVDRTRFDGELCTEAVRSGAALFRGVSARACVRRNGFWVCNGVRGRFIVDATGRNGLRLEGPASRQTEDTLLVFTMRLSHAEGGAPGDLRTQIGAVPSGWWYWSPVPDRQSVAMFFTGLAEYRRRLRSEPLLGCLGQAPALADLVASGRLLDAKWVAVSSSLRQSLHGNGWLAVGDSASCYDPLSGRGIFKAVQQAQVASQALDLALRGRPDALADYAERVRREFHDYSIQRKSYYAMERRWPSSSFWIERQRNRTAW
jgi:flavin-dependent dehydrogenase